MRRERRGVRRLQGRHDERMKKTRRERGERKADEEHQGALERIVKDERKGEGEEGGKLR